MITQVNGDQDSDIRFSSSFRTRRVQSIDHNDFGKLNVWKGNNKVVQIDDRSDSPTQLTPHFKVGPVYEHDFETE